MREKKSNSFVTVKTDGASPGNFKVSIGNSGSLNWNLDSRLWIPKSDTFNRIEFPAQSSKFQLKVGHFHVRQLLHWVQGDFHVRQLLHWVQGDYYLAPNVLISVSQGKMRLVNAWILDHVICRWSSKFKHDRVMTGRNQEDQADLKKKDPHGNLAYFRVFASNKINMHLTGECSAHVYKKQLK